MKQETLEEVADLWSIDTKNVHPADSYIAKQGFIAGAKWQAENMFSEEEVKPLLDAIKYFIDKVENGTIRSKTTYKMYKEIFEQFKNK